MVLTALRRHFSLLAAADPNFRNFYIGEFALGFLPKSKFRHGSVLPTGPFFEKRGFSLPYTYEMNFLYCFLVIAIGHIWGSFYFNDNKQLLAGFKKWENSLGKTLFFGVLASISLILIILFSADSKPFVYFVF